MSATSTPHEALALALADALERALIVPCASSDAWTSDDPDDRQQAAQECDGCPCLAECAAAGQGERWGVWAGADVSPTTRARRPRKASA